MIFSHRHSHDRSHKTNGEVTGVTVATIRQRRCRLRQCVNRRSHEGCFRSVFSFRVHVEIENESDRFRFSSVQVVETIFEYLHALSLKDLTVKKGHALVAHELGRIWDEGFG